jgi:hypothetical protein
VSKALLTGSAVLLLALAASSAGNATTACTAGQTSVAGVSYESFCGPAKATVKAGGKTLSFTNGQCQIKPQSLTVNIGSAILGSQKPAKPYFGFDVGKVGGATFGGKAATADGTYSNLSVAFNANGTRYLVLRATVTLKNNRKAGTFSGSLLTGGAASGSFSC